MAKFKEKINPITGQFDLVNDGGVSSGSQFLSLERLGAYLYKVTFDAIPAKEFGLDTVLGACSSYVDDGKLYRNFDWKYDNTASFLVVTKDFKGMGSIIGLDDSNLDMDKVGQLPYHVVDGVNSNGIMVSTHVLYNDWDWHSAGTGAYKLTEVVYYLLENIKSIDTIATDIADIIDNVASTEALDSAGYLLQFVVTDGTTTYAILPPESSTGSYALVDISSNPKLTNFRWVSDSSVSRGDLQDHPTGVERFNLMPCSLEDLKFTAAYESSDRLSEFIGINGTDKDSTDEELTEIYEQAAEMYAERERDGQTRQTVHSIVYSSKGIESLRIQEKWDIDYAGNIKQNAKGTTSSVSGIWKGTQDEYDALDNVDDSVFYIIIPSSGS